jgi:hypothetical protein
MTTDEIMALADEFSVTKARYWIADREVTEGMVRNSRQMLEHVIESLAADAARYRRLRDAHPADDTVWVAMGKPGSPAGVSFSICFT